MPIAPVPCVRNLLQQHNFTGLQFVAPPDRPFCQKAARSPLLLADLPEKALSGGFRGPIATRVIKPQNDDPSIVEPIELTNPLAHSAVIWGHPQNLPAR